MSSDIIAVLCDLFQLDFDAVSAYEQALKQIDDQEIYEDIESFRQDHLRHIDDLEKIIIKLGSKPPNRSKDFKGFLIQGFTAIRSATGTIGALRAMETNEETTNKYYSDALKNTNEMSEEIKQLLEKNYTDEERHLKYIQMTLKKLDQK